MSRADRQEVEFKLRLADEAQHGALLALLFVEDAPPEPVLQTNHFFDTADHALRAAGLALRLRAAKGRWMFTAKGKSRDLDAAGVLTARAEEEREIGDDEARGLLSGERDPVPFFASLFADGAPPIAAALESAAGGRALQHVGSFENRRTKASARLDDGQGGQVELLLEVDRTSFPGGRVDCELEAEVPAERAPLVEGALRLLLDRLGAPWSTAPSKAARFFELVDARGRGAPSGESGAE